jgi:uncharacterized protein YacL
MLLWGTRAIFLIIIVAVLLVNLTVPEVSGEVGRANFYVILLAGVFFGLLVGIVISWALIQVFDMLIDIYRIELSQPAVRAIKWMLGISICFLIINIVVRTKDDVRFVIPYVEFQKQTKGARPLVLDTSAIIDGRIADLYKSKLFDAPLIVPRFVLNEIQLISDSADKLKRNRGRRGLDILKEMQSNTSIDITIDDTVRPPGYNRLQPHQSRCCPRS